MKIRKESFFVGVFVLVVLVTSGFFAMGHSPEFMQFGDYMKNAGLYSSDISDSQIIDLVKENGKLLSADKQKVLSGFSDEEIIAVARGNKEGMKIVSKLTRKERIIAEDLFKEIQVGLSSGSVGEANAPPMSYCSSLLGCGAKPEPKCNSPPNGNCTPGRSQCVQESQGSCTFNCNNQGQWVTPGTWVQGGICEGE